MRRSQMLTTLEMVMSFWALGYMLDEVPHFNTLMLTDSRSSDFSMRGAPCSF